MENTYFCPCLQPLLINASLTGLTFFNLTDTLSSFCPFNQVIKASQLIVAYLGKDAQRDWIGRRSYN